MKKKVLNKTEVTSSEPNPVAQPQMWVDWYKIIYGGNEQDAKKAWGRKMYLLGY